MQFLKFRYGELTNTSTWSGFSILINQFISHDHMIALLLFHIYLFSFNQSRIVVVQTPKVLHNCDEIL